MPRRIWFVDSNPIALEEYLRAFADMGTSWDVRGFNTAAETIVALEKEPTPIDVLLADSDLFDATGVELLDQVWQRFPKTVRYLLAETSDSELVLKCVLGAHQVLAKPVDPSRLRAAIDRALSLNDLVRNRRIQELVSRMRTFPSMPTLYQNVLRELSSPDASPQRVGDLIGRDLAMTSKLIQMVNSAFYARDQQVTDPGEAVVLLGMETIRSLILSIGAFAQFDRVKPLYFSIDRVWRHSLAVAVSARQISQLVAGDSAVAHDAYTAGLLHDVGKLVLACNFEDKYGKAVKLAQEKGIPLCAAEREVLGVDHAETGAYLLTHWSMPPSIVEAVAGHHAIPAQIEGGFTARVAVHAANALQFELFPGRSGFPETQPSFDYPAALCVTPYLDEIRAVLQGTNTQGSPRTDTEIFFARPPAPQGTAVERDAKVQWIAPLRKVALALSAIAILILVACAVARLTSSFAITHPASDPTTVANANTASAASASAPRDSRQAVAVRTAPPATRRDGAKFPELKLQGILFATGKSHALINGQNVRLGDRVAGARLVDISRTTVTLEFNDERRLLAINGN